MFQIPEKLTSAGKSQLDAQLNFLNTVTEKAFEHTGKALALHFSTSKALLEKQTSTAQQLIAAPDVRSLISVGASQAVPAVEQLFAYGREMLSLATAAQKELISSAQSGYAQFTAGAKSAAHSAATSGPVLSLVAPAAVVAAVETVAPPAAAAVKEAAQAAPDLFTQAEETSTPLAAASVAAPTVAAPAAEPVPDIPTAASTVTPIAAAVATTATAAPKTPLAAASVAVKPKAKAAVAVPPLKPEVVAKVKSASKPPAASAKPPAGKPALVKPVAAASEPKQRDSLSIKASAKGKK